MNWMHFRLSKVDFPLNLEMDNLALYVKNLSCFKKCHFTWAVAL